MSAKRFSYVSRTSVLGMQLNGLEVVHVIWTGQEWVNQTNTTGMQTHLN
jgi:hypothetical protein